MTRAEVMATSLGEMLDMLSALSIYNGSAKQKKTAKIWSYDEVMALE